MGLLAGQLAVAPHAHAGLSSDEHARHETPHFHWFGSDHHHAEPPPVDHKADEESLVNHRDVAHDADAIYIASLGIATTSSSPPLAITLSLLVAMVAAPVDWCESGSLDGARPAWHPPDGVMDDSDAYLTLRHLRI